MLPWCEGARYTEGVYPVALEGVHRHGDWETAKPGGFWVDFSGVFGPDHGGECQLVLGSEAGLSVLG